MNNSESRSHYLVRLLLGWNVVRIVWLLLIVLASCDKSQGQIQTFRQLANTDVQTFTQLVQNNPSLLTGTDEHGTTLFDDVAGAGRIDLAKVLLFNHADVNVRDIAKATPLFYAALGNQLQMARFLLDNGADINAKNDELETPLHEVSEVGAVGDVPLDMPRLLLSYHADVNAKNDLGKTPLHLAVGHKNFVELLLAHQANINVKDDGGETPLHTAAVLGQSDMVELLVSRGADMDAKDNNGLTPLDLAALGDPSFPGVPGFGPHKEIVELLRSDHALYTAFDAAAIGDIENLKKMVAQNPSLVTAKDFFGKTLLHYAAQFGQIEMVEFLIANHAEVDVRDKLNQSPLHYAAAAGRAGIAELLLANHADVNARANEGVTPLHLAAENPLTDADVVEVLLAHGADVNAKTSAGQTPLAIAGQNSAVAQLLITHGGHR